MKKCYEVDFFENSPGVSPVQSWLNDQDDKVKALFAQILDTFEEFGGNVPKKLPRSRLRKVRSGRDVNLWEIRVKHNTNIYRLLYFWHDRQCIVLHGFHKKSQVTPKPEIETALYRYKRYRQIKRKNLINHTFI